MSSGGYDVFWRPGESRVAHEPSVFGLLGAAVAGMVVLALAYAVCWWILGWLLATAHWAPVDLDVGVALGLGGVSALIVTLVGAHLRAANPG